MTFLPASQQLSVSRITILFGLMILTGGLVIWTGASPAYGEEAAQVKAAFIYNFAKFVEWPPAAFSGPTAPLVLGVLEEDPLVGALEALASKVVQGRRLVIKRAARVEDLRKCQIMVFGGPKGTQYLGVLMGLPILTITDEVENFARVGGIINLLTREDRIRFQINLQAAHRAGLKISSQLLKLAIIVE